MRRKDREVTDFERIRYILDSCKYLHLGLSDCGNPYIVPMNFCYRFEDGKLVFYVHCAQEGRKLDILEENNSCCVQMECETKLIEGAIACKYGYSFYSFIGFGRAFTVDSPEEKITALELLMKSQTGKEFSFTEDMVAPVKVIRIICDNYSAKHRA